MLNCFHTLHITPGSGAHKKEGKFNYETFCEHVMHADGTILTLFVGF